MIKLDFGALVGGYHADMTRTIAFGQPAGRAAEGPRRRARGAAGRHRRRACGRDRGGGRRRGRDVIERGGLRRRGSCTASVTGSGLEIHEAPRLGAKQDDALPAGAVVTVEPGIYLPGSAASGSRTWWRSRDDGCVVVGTSTRDLIEL